ncbi:MAG: diaminopimelate epimerase [Candidatus Kapaibacterium sp.]|jgi:diaminopimelate epimerase|nr:diaminopimelate epimerase [Candidatus Kapabacteria bacterium]
MKRKIEVFRMSGAGNLFSVIDNSKYQFNDVELISLAVTLCSKNEINDFEAEGLLAITTESEFDFDVKFLNPDGSSGMMCGNGGRCAFDFAANKLIPQARRNDYKFRMAGNIYSGMLTDDGVRLTMPAPAHVELMKTIIIDGKEIQGSYINVSSDHFVVELSQLKDFDVSFDSESIVEFAPKIRYHKDFGLAGVNVNIYKKVADAIYLKTFERGVENITGACGTGSVSTAIHCYGLNKTKLPLMIMPPSSIPVFIDFEFDYNDRIKKVFLSGHSEIISKDIVEINF